MANEEWIQGMREEFKFTHRVRLSAPQTEPVKGATHVEKGAFHTKVVGVTFDNPDGRNRQDIIAHLSQSSKIHLERDRGNAYDSNAVKVVDIDGNQLGFLSKEISADLAPRLDKGAVFNVSISSLTGGGDLARGVNILIN